MPLLLGEIVHMTSSTLTSRAGSRGYASYDYESGLSTARATWSSWTSCSTATLVDALSMIVFSRQRLRQGPPHLVRGCGQHPAQTLGDPRSGGPSAARSSPATVGACARMLAKCYGGATSPKKSWKSRKRAKEDAPARQRLLAPARRSPPCSSSTATTIDLDFFRSFPGGEFFPISGGQLRILVQILTFFRIFPPQKD